MFDKIGKVKTLFDKNIETNHHYFSPNSESFIQNDKKQLFVSLMYNNTFYRLDRGNTDPVISVDFGKYGMKII